MILSSSVYATTTDNTSSREAEITKQTINHPTTRLLPQWLSHTISTTIFPIRPLSEAIGNKPWHIGTKVIAYHPRRRCGRKRAGASDLLPRLAPASKDTIKLAVRPGELSIAYAGTCTARGKQASGSPDTPITRRCVCPDIHKPADAKRLYRSAAPSIWLRMTPHTQPDGTSKAIPLVMLSPQ